MLGFPGVDVGGGWLIFKLPPAEIAVHPTDGLGKHESARGVTISHPVRDERWGLLASIQLPSGAALSIYQPRHPTAYDLEG